MDDYAIINQLIEADEMEKLKKLDRRYDLKVVSKPVQMLEHDGTFCDSNVEKLVESATKLLTFRESYAIISIIGLQSSGKSYLVNQLFGTNFGVMGSRIGRTQTTQGMLLARSTKPCALIMNVDGTDGRERGEDDVSFERQAVLFALTMSDIMIINLWLGDIGRQGGGIRVLKTVFQERVKLDPGKTKVVVVLRGCDSEMPFKTLEEDILKTMKEITKLREWFAKQNFAGLRQEKNPILGFSLSAKNIWDAIRQNKPLDLPGNKLAVSTYICEKVANECLAAVIRDKDFEMLNDAASSDEFIVKLKALQQNCVTQYNKDTEMSDETQRDAKRDVLKEKFLRSAEPFAKKMLGKIHSEFFSEEKAKVATSLNIADDPAMEAPTVVEYFLKLFTRSCGGLKSEYESLCLESCNMLRNELRYHAKATILNVKEQRMKEEVKRAKAEAERMKKRAKAEAKLEPEEAEAMFVRKLQELELAEEEVARAEKNAEAARKEVVRRRDIKEKAKLLLNT